MATIINVSEGPRGCGFRKPGGFYLRTDGVDSFQCGKIPIPLCVCPTCGQGIKQTRGYAWIKGELINSAPCSAPEEHCAKCKFMDAYPDDEDIMLIWIGVRFYETVQSFMDEARVMGISRRLPSFPRGFELGQTKVALAHPRAITTQGEDGPEYTPGIFYLFKPERLEYVVGGDETEEKLDKLEEKDVTLVRVSKKQINQNLIV